MAFSCLTYRDYVRIVYPDGHIENVSRPCSVYELLLGKPDYFVCNTGPFNLTNRMAADAQLERGLTYFVCARPNARPFLDLSAKKPTRSSRFLPRFSRGSTSGREIRSPTPSNAQSGKVFDFHSAAMQLETMKNAGGTHHQSSPHLAVNHPPRDLIKIVFFRHCLKALRLPKDCVKFMEPAQPDEHSMVTIAEIKPAKSVSRSELGSNLSRRQNFCSRRGRRRRNVVWKPVLQSISEVMPIQEFEPCVSREDPATLFKYSADPRQRKTTSERSVYVA